MLAMIWDSNLMYFMQICCGIGVGHVAVCRYWKHIKLFAAEIHSFPRLSLFQFACYKGQAGV